MAKETCTLAGGCFWCLDSAFRYLQGVNSVTSGYAGGTTENPSYEQICRGDTGHAEVVRLEYDTSQIDFETLLDIFFTLHDPTTLNRQGADVGTQYRSAIFYESEAQKSIAERAIRRINASGIWSSPVVTALEPLTRFYSAEDYHQDYFTRQPGNPYCQVVISPKLAKFREKFAHLLH
jgi:peptide-methionine (S)-S-oxide reductase